MVEIQLRPIVFPGYFSSLSAGWSRFDEGGWTIPRHTWEVRVIQGGLGWNSLAWLILHHFLQKWNNVVLQCNTKFIVNFQQCVTCTGEVIFNWSIDWHYFDLSTFFINVWRTPVGCKNFIFALKIISECKYNVIKCNHHCVIHILLKWTST